MKKSRMHGDTWAWLGRTIAPPRFLLFVAVFAAASIATSLLAGSDLRIGLLVGFDLAALAFLASALPLLNDNVIDMRRTARDNDANRATLLVITVVISLVVLIAVGTLVVAKQELHWPRLTLVVGSLLLAWFFANVVFALHYAHLYYSQDEKGDRGGLKMPDAREPNYWDFIYFSFTLGMTFQTSDISVQKSHIRKVMLGQSMAAFFFNMGILAFTVNALGGM